MAKTTITRIAKEMGITPSTVSRALAGSPRVREKTRIAIEKKALELGYERNFMASGLRKGRADIVGIIVPRINREFFSNIISGAESILNGRGYSVLICQTHEKLEDEIRALRTLRSNQAAGIIMSHAIGSENGDHIREILGDGMVLVQCDRVFSDLPGAKIVSNNFQGAYEATRFLVENGYGRIGTLAGYMNSEAYKERLEGYLQALADMGRRADPEIIFYDTILRETGYESGIKAIGKGCDALYSAGDFSALGAMEAAMEKGLRIPEDFGIIGTADETFASLMSPSMSSLALNPYEMGRRAAQAFLTSLDTGSAIGVVTVPMELKKRQSSNRISWQK